MQRPLSEEDKVDDKQSRKRYQNRFAQQKYRKKLKSHIQDLEKRAAVADHILKANLPSNRLSHNDLSQPCHDLGQSSKHKGTVPTYQSDTALASVMQTCEPTAQMNSSISGSAVDNPSGHYPGPSNDTALMVAGPSSNIFDEVDFLKAFTISDDHLWSKPLPLHEAGNLEIQSDNNEISESLSFSTRHGLLETLKSASPVPSQSSPSIAISKLLHKPPAQEQANLESRVERVLQSIKKAGFESPDSFISSYYTSTFKDLSAVKTAQHSSRSKGLPQVLEDLRVKARSWSMWESSGYKDTIVRSAADLIADEFERLGRKKYSCEIELQQNMTRMPQVPDGSSLTPQLPSIAAELKKTLRDEVGVSSLYTPVLSTLLMKGGKQLPNLYALTAALSAQKTASAQSTRVRLLITTIQIIIASGDEPVQEAAKWVFDRIAPGLMGDAIDTPGEDFDNGFIEGG